VGNDPLISGSLYEALGIVVIEEADGSRAHGAAVAGGRRRGPGFVPGNAQSEPPGGLLGAPPSPDDPVLGEDSGDPVRVVLGVEPPSRHVALHQLPGELGVVGVLPEGERAAPVSSSLALTELLLYVSSADLGRLALDHEPQSVP
jgi:hypothetical protein